MTTPAQAYGHPDFVTDVPIQGPTDQGLREASCWFARNRVPKDPACVDCGNGPVPSWARHSLCPANRGPGSGIGEAISLGGRGVLGFAFGAAGSPEVYSTLTLDQQSWVAAALSHLNDNIVKSSGTSCPGWAPAIGPASSCFQAWYNGNYAAPNGPANPLRTDGVFDEDTLCALLGITNSYPLDFINVFPDPAKQHCQGGAAVVQPPPAPVSPAPISPAPAPVSPPPPVAPAPATPPLVAPSPAAIAAKSGVNVLGVNLSKGEIIGIGAGVAAVGGLIYAGTRGRRKK